MMKQALLITAYKDFDHLNDIVHYFDNGLWECYIHLDRKNLPDENVLQRLRTASSVKLVSSHYVVNLGGRNHLKAYLLLAEEALKNPDIGYFHLISGSDFPVKSLSYFQSFATVTAPKDYMTYYPMPYAHWEDGGMPRIEYYNFYDVYDAKKDASKIARLVTFQKKWGIKRKLSAQLPPLYAGDTWWSLTRNTLSYVVNYTQQQPYLLNRLKHTFCPEELYFQTVIMNSPHASNVVNDNLRYVDWSPERSTHPANPSILDSRDIPILEQSDFLFARKFEHPGSSELKNKLIQQKD